MQFCVQSLKYEKIYQIYLLFFLVFFFINIVQCYNYSINVVFCGVIVRYFVQS